MTDLDEFLDAPPDGTELWRVDEEGRWSIMGYQPEARDGVATWAMRRLGKIKAERARIVAVADAEVRRIGEWVDSADKPLEGDENFFTGCLTEYLRHIRRERGEDEDNPVTKSYRLPTGTITGRRQPERIEVVDEERFVEWAKESGNASLIRTKEAPDKAAIKRMKVGADGVTVILEGGEVARFVEVRRSPERLEAKPEVGA